MKNNRQIHLQPIANQSQASKEFTSQEVGVRSMKRTSHRIENDSEQCLYDTHNQSAVYVHTFDMLNEHLQEKQKSRGHHSRSRSGMKIQSRREFPSVTAFAVVDISDTICSELGKQDTIVSLVGRTNDFRGLNPAFSRYEIEQTSSSYDQDSTTKETPVMERRFTFGKGQRERVFPQKQKWLCSNWQAEDIEVYLAMKYAQFRKYKYNIFVLQRAALKIQHWFFHKQNSLKIKQSSQPSFSSCLAADYSKQMISFNAMPHPNEGDQTEQISQYQEMTESETLDFMRVEQIVQNLQEIQSDISNIVALSSGNNSRFIDDTKPIHQKDSNLLHSLNNDSFVLTNINTNRSSQINLKASKGGKQTQVNRAVNDHFKRERKPALKQSQVSLLSQASPIQKIVQSSKSVLRDKDQKRKLEELKQNQNNIKRSANVLEGGSNQVSNQSSMGQNELQKYLVPTESNNEENVEQKRDNMQSGIKPKVEYLDLSSPSPAQRQDYQQNQSVNILSQGSSPILVLRECQLQSQIMSPDDETTLKISSQQTENNTQRSSILIQSSAVDTSNSYNLLSFSKRNSPSKNQQINKSPPSAKCHGNKQKHMLSQSSSTKSLLLNQSNRISDLNLSQIIKDKSHLNQQQKRALNSSMSERSLRVLPELSMTFRKELKLSQPNQTQYKAQQDVSKQTSTAEKEGSNVLKQQFKILKLQHPAAKKHQFEVKQTKITLPVRQSNSSIIGNKRLSNSSLQSFSRLGKASEQSTRDKPNQEGIDTKSFFKDPIVEKLAAKINSKYKQILFESNNKQSQPNQKTIDSPEKESKNLMKTNLPNLNQKLWSNEDNDQTQRQRQREDSTGSHRSQGNKYLKNLTTRYLSKSKQRDSMNRSQEFSLTTQSIGNLASLKQENYDFQDSLKIHRLNIKNSINQEEQAKEGATLKQSNNENGQSNMRIEQDVEYPSINNREKPHQFKSHRFSSVSQSKVFSNEKSGRHSSASCRRLLLQKRLTAQSDLSQNQSVDANKLNSDYDDKMFQVASSNIEMIQRLQNHRKMNESQIIDDEECL